MEKTNWNELISSAISDAYEKYGRNYIEDIEKFIKDAIDFRLSHLAKTFHKGKGKSFYKRYLDTEFIGVLESFIINYKDYIESNPFNTDVFIYSCKKMVKHIPEIRAAFTNRTLPNFMFFMDGLIEAYEERMGLYKSKELD